MQGLSGRSSRIYFMCGLRESGDRVSGGVGGGRESPLNASVHQYISRMTPELLCTFTVLFPYASWYLLSPAPNSSPNSWTKLSS